jgi:hypothetical protein
MAPVVAAGPDAKHVGDEGFNVVADTGLLTLDDGLALPSDNDGSLRNGRVAVAVRS